MAMQLNPYLHFDGNAAEAMAFYQSVFGGDLDVSRFGDYGHPDPAAADLVMHSQLRAPNGFVLMGADTPPEMDFRPGRAVTISLSGDDEALRGYWQQLSDGGTVEVELAKQMWGDEFGQCTDRFGVAWLVNIAGAQTAAPA